MYHLKWRARAGTPCLTALDGWATSNRVHAMYFATLADKATPTPMRSTFLALGSRFMPGDKRFAASSATMSHVVEVDLVFA